MKRSEPIRIGDHFKMRSGSVWEVIRTRPGGRVELFNRAESRFADYYTHQVRAMQRLPSQLGDDHGR